MKDFLRNEWKAHNKEQLVAGIVHFWSTRMNESKCQRYISHLRKVIPRIVELNGAATGMWMDQEMIPVTALEYYIDVLDLLFDINSETTTGNIQNVCVKICPVLQSYDHLISTLRFPILVRRPIYIESGLGYSMGPPVHCQFC